MHLLNLSSQLVIRAFIIRLLGSLVSRFAFLLFPLGMGKTKTRTQKHKTI